MSRSYRSTPICGHAGSSEKQDKRIYNRSLRRAVHTILHSRNGEDCDSLVLPEIREHSDAWNMSKDGKSYDSSLAEVRHSLGCLVRVRDGRRRKILVVTSQTYELVRRRQEDLALYFGYRSWMEDYIASRDVHYYVEGLRK